MYEAASAPLLALTLRALIDRARKTFGITPTILFTHGDRKDNKDQHFMHVFKDQYALEMRVLRKEVSNDATKDDPERKYVTLYEVVPIENDGLGCAIDKKEMESTANDDRENKLDQLLSLPFVSLDRVEGTWGKPALQLFAGHVPDTFTSLGFHCHPHLGIYGQDYTPAFPIVALSLPPSDQRLSSSSLSLPPDVLELVRSKANVAEYYFLIHSYPGRQPCQKFICTRNDEINLMLHPMVFANNVVNEEFASIRTVHVGAFATEGVEEAHLDVKDGGVPFGRMEKRTVAMHDMSFSPCNMHIRMKYDDDDVGKIERGGFAFFCTVAWWTVETTRAGIAGQSVVKENSGIDQCTISVHCVPLGKTVEDNLWSMISESNTLEDLVALLSTSAEHMVLLSKLSGWIQ
jgi:hypothetical protein